MGYAVKEIFLSLQGEGMQAGRPAVFCRFAGCNLWSGREIDRTTARCSFCDTDFVGIDAVRGGRFSTADSLADAIAARWPERPARSGALIVFTGGEPCLQLDAALFEAVKARGFVGAVETNGTLPVPPGADWVCVSPKAGTDLVRTYGDELKLVYPQKSVVPEEFEALDFTHFLLQPADVGGPAALLANARAAAAYCLRRPTWRLSLQSHKLLGID